MVKNVNESVAMYLKEGSSKPHIGKRFKSKREADFLLIGDSEENREGMIECNKGRKADHSLQFKILAASCTLETSQGRHKDILEH